MLLFAEKRGDPLVDNDIGGYDIGGYEMITMVTNDTLLSPLKNIPSSRDYIPYF